MTSQERTAVALLAHLLLHDAQPAKAAQLLRALDLVEPGRPRVLAALALAQLRCGDAAPALETLERLALAGAHDAAYHLLQSQALLAGGRPGEAAASMSACLRARAQALGLPPFVRATDTVH